LEPFVLLTVDEVVAVGLGLGVEVEPAGESGFSVLLLAALFAFRLCHIKPVDSVSNSSDSNYSLNIPNAWYDWSERVKSQPETHRSVHRPPCFFFANLLAPPTSDDGAAKFISIPSSILAELIYVIVV